MQLKSLGLTCALVLSVLGVATPAQATTTCDAFGSITMGKYWLNNNTWGASSGSGRQCISNLDHSWVLQAGRPDRLIPAFWSLFRGGAVRGRPRVAAGGGFHGSGVLCWSFLGRLMGLVGWSGPCG